MNTPLVADGSRQRVPTLPCSDWVVDGGGPLVVT